MPFLSSLNQPDLETRDRTIRRLHKSGRVSIKNIAKRFDITIVRVRQIIRGGILRPGKPSIDPTREPLPIEALTKRERLYFDLFCQGFAAKDIALQMDARVSRIYELRDKVLRKFNLCTEMQLIVYAVRQGWITQEFGRR
jgi:DNA-binding NarL/FixJ family response regulator